MYKMYYRFVTISHIRKFIGHLMLLTVACNLIHSLGVPCSTAVLNESVLPHFA